jgi:uncharacterized membrane-anchored protein
MFWNVTMRVEKKINIGQGRLYLMADCFNIFNSAIENRSYEKYFGDVYTDNGTQWVGPPGDISWTNVNSGYINEILNPRIWRFGARFEF